MSNIKLVTVRLVVTIALSFLSLYNITLAQTAADRLNSIEKLYAVIDKIGQQYAASNHFPGFVFGLLVDGKLVHTFSNGYTDIDKKIPVTPKSCFRIASMTKSFTAMAIVKLRDEGKLKLDDPVYLYIPEMLVQQSITKDAGPITLRHLLSHAAGFPEDNPWGDRQLAVTDEEMIAMIRKGISFSNVPGVTYEYSNMGFAMLGYIIKKVSGQTYQNYINENILAPLAMTHTYWDVNKVPASDLALGYRWLNGNYVKQPMLTDGAYGAMGGMITSMEDFASYALFHASAWPAGNGKEVGPIKRSSVREMQQPWNVPVMNATYKYPGGRTCPTVRTYCYGLSRTVDCEGRIKVGHSGGLPGFGSEWTILQDYGIGIISFSNVTYGSASYFNTMLIDSLIAMAKLKPLPKAVSPILEQRKNQLVALLPNWNNAEASGIFAVNFFLDYFPDSLRKEATGIFSRAGKIVSGGKMNPINNLRGSFMLEGEKKNIEVFFTLSPETPARIQEYHIREVEK